MQYPTVDRVMDPMELTARLAKMSSDQLRNYAQMHSDDANVVALALAESKRRQAMQPHPQMGQQPTVLEQAIGEMGQGTNAELPEDVGIGQLPAKNIEHMADGGIVAFARGGDAGSDPVSAYKQYARKRAQEAGIDPNLVEALFQHESKYNPNAVSKRGAIGIGQLMPKTAAAHGLTPEDARDPYKNIDASIKELSQLNKKYGGDQSKILNAYNWGQGNLDKALAAGSDARPAETSKHESAIAALMTGMVPAASAVAAPAQPQPSGSSAFMDDIKGLWDKITGSDKEKKAYLDEYQRKRQTQQAENEATKQYFLGDTADYNLAKGRAAQTAYPGQGSHAAYDAQVPQDQPEQGPPATPGMHPQSGYNPEGAWDDVNAAASAPEKAPAAAPEEKSWLDKMSGDDWMNLGLALLKNRSPYWQEAVGTAGETMMAGKRAAEKAALEKQKAESEAKYRDALAGYYGQKDDTAIQRMALDELSRARTAADNDIKSLVANDPGLKIAALKDPTIIERKRQQILAEYLQAANENIKAVTGKDMNLGRMSGGPVSRADFTLDPGKGLVPNR